MFPCMLIAFVSFRELIHGVNETNILKTCRRYMFLFEKDKASLIFDETDRSNCSPTRIAGGTLLNSCES